MAWSTPSSRTTGILISAAIWNSDVVDNPIALRAGAIAISSQAAQDFLYASSATQLARLAAVDGRGPRYSASGGWAIDAAPVFAYAATVADVQNTVAETDACHFTVPANAWGDGELIKVEVRALFKQNSGTNRTAIFKVNVGAGAQVQLLFAGGGAAGTGLFSGDSATEFKIVFPVYLRRVGSTVWINHWENPFITAGDSTIIAANTFSALQQPIDGTSTPTNFTDSNVVTLKITLDAADANYYLKPQVPQVLHFKS